MVKLAPHGAEPAIFFASATEFRDWLEANHARADEVWVGFHKKASRRTGLTYAEAVDEALCYGWIDGLTRGRDEHAYVQRFTPRRPGSNWSRVNVAKVGQLTRAGRMQAAGLRAFEQRAPESTGIYTYETRPADLPDDLAAEFRGNATAWQHFAAQPPSYRRAVTWWIVSAKRPETRRRRLEKAIEASAAGRRIDLLSPG